MRIGIIGTGWGARVQVPAFRLAGLEISGLAGQNREKTAREAGRLGVAAFDDWRDLLAGDAELISIVTPPAFHREMALAALAAGKHVLCEKPTALNTAEALELAAAAAQHPGKLSLLDHELRFLPALRLAREIIQRGDL
ncbi:MAG TPA: Gfo/Idh/MocA family oxidoreductase, partial [Herpetosiphonaceae bacterium]